MNHPNTRAALGGALSLLLLAGCAAGHVNPADRDTTGAYDGVWVGSVAEPRAKREQLPGNWYMQCDWEPYEIYLVVDGGRIRLGKLEGKTPVSADGDFRIDVTGGAAGMTGGVMSGNGRFVTIYSGNLAGDAPHGRYAQWITSIGTNGCNSKVRFRRHDESAARGAST